MSTVSSPQLETAPQAQVAPAQPGAVRSGALLFAAMVVSTGATYLFYLLAGRLLGPKDYGNFAALLAIVTLASLPFNAVQMALSREVSGNVARGDETDAARLSRAVIRAGAIATLVLLALFLVIMVPLGDLLNLGSVAQLGLIAVALAPAVLYPIFLGDLQGHQQFGRLSAGTAFPLVLRLGLFVVLALVGWRLYGALAALAVGSIAGVVLPGWWRRDLLHGVLKPQVSVRPFLVALVPVMVGILGITALTNVDVLMVKARLASEDAGIYAAASAFAKVAFFMPTAIVAILFPRVAARRARGEETEDILGRAVLVTVGFCALLFLAYGVVGHFLVRISYGSEFQDASSLLGLFGAGMTFFSVANVLVSYHLSRHDNRFAWMVAAAAVCQAIALAVVPGHLRTFLWVNAGVGAALLVSHELVMGSSIPAIRSGFAHAWEELALPARARTWPARMRAAVLSSRAPLLEALLVLVAATGLCIGLTWPLVAHLGTQTLGAGGDVSGTIAGFWQQAHALGYHVTGTTHVAITGAPYGWEQGNGVNIQSSFVYYPAYLLTKLWGEIVAYNLVATAGLVLSGAAMYWLVRRLVRSRLIAAWAGLVFMVFPWHLEKVEAHASLAHLEGFPLLALALVAWYRRPDARSVLYLGGSVLILWLTSGYYGVIALVALAALLPITAWFQRRRFGLGGAAVRLAVAGTIALGVGAVVYGIASLGESGGQIAPKQDISFLAYFGARIWEFFVPAADNGMLGDSTYGFLSNHLHGSNFAESTLYVGWLTLLLALGFVVYCIVRRRSISEERRFLCAAASAMVVVAILFMPPYPISLGSVNIPTPTWVLWRLVGQFRVPTRFMPLLMTGLIVLAALALLLLRSRIRRRSELPLRRRLVWLGAMVLAAGISFVELSIFPSATVATIGVPHEYQILAKAPPGTLVEYPLGAAGEAATSDYLFWQRYHGRPLLNGAPGGSYPDIVRQALIDPSAPGVAGGLAALGVTAVISRPVDYRFDGGIFSVRPNLGPGYRLLGRARDSSVWQVVAKPAPLAVFPYGFWYTETPRGLWPSRWTSAERAIVQVIAPRAGTYLVQFHARAYKQPRRLVITGRGSSWAVEVPPTGDRSFYLPVELPRGRSNLILKISPGEAIAAPPDARAVGVYVSNWLFQGLSGAEAAKWHPLRPFPVSKYPR